MNDYVEVRFDIFPCSETSTDILAAMLCEHDYESFVPDEKGVTAYVKSERYDETVIPVVLENFPMPADVSWNKVVIEGQDWNKEWERHYFKPIVVGDKCVIHSSFHKDIPLLPYDIVIDPKMAFGTGHHATTSLIIEQLVDMSLEGKSVIDMGTGTGILAILSAMRGAKSVKAVEIDPVAHVNAIENIRINNVAWIDVILGDASSLRDISPADVFIANINRNIITADIIVYSTRLKTGGDMLLSGFYEEDIPVVLEVAEKYGLRYCSHTVREKWTCLRLTNG